MNSKFVLIVDDNKKFLESAIKFLTTDSHFSAVGWAFTASEAFEKIQKFKPDLILIDFSLPDMNGFEATRIIKQLPEPPAVVMVSVNNNSEYEKKALRSGVDAYLCKSEFGTKIIPLLEGIFNGN